MKRLFLTAALVVVIILLMSGADLRMPNEPATTVRLKNCGYTIIEAGKGINCNGDTIRILKIHRPFTTKQIL
jgi:hypothetical protein